MPCQSDGCGCGCGARSLLVVSRSNGVCLKRPTSIADTGGGDDAGADQLQFSNFAPATGNKFFFPLSMLFFFFFFFALVRIWRPDVRSWKTIGLALCTKCPRRWGKISCLFHVRASSWCWVASRVNWEKGAICGGQTELIPFRSTLTARTGSLGWIGSGQGKNVRICWVCLRLAGLVSVPSLMCPHGARS